jgi:hypothetical protein
MSVLSPFGGGNLNLRDAGPIGSSSALSRPTMLAAFPAAWMPGAVAARSPLSASIQQVPPSVTIMAPPEAAVVTGNVPLSAVVDDDVSIARVQFSVDGQPVGAPVLSAPFTFAWDSSAASTRQPHMISATAVDLLGRSATSAIVTVQVDNGPTIGGIAVNRGLTASSVRINWSTDVLADGQVEFGRTALYGLSTPIDPRADWRHEAQLTGLAPGTTYHFRVRSRDANGVVAVSPDYTFATAEP